MRTRADLSPDAAAPKTRRVFRWVFLALVAVVNLFVLSVSWHDQSFGAIFLAVIGGPILNGVLLLVGLVAIPFLRRGRAQFSISQHLALSLGVPIAAVVADFLIIMSMGLHGC